MKTDHAVIEYAGDDYFVAVTPSGHAQVLDVQAGRYNAPSPVELVIVALGSCTGADVISILKKKRQVVTRYRVEVRSERREEHPRSYRKFEVRHLVRGRGVSSTAVARAIELSATKYCGVSATVQPTAEVVHSFEIEEEHIAAAD